MHVQPLFLFPIFLWKYASTPAWKRASVEVYWYSYVEA